METINKEKLFFLPQYKKDSEHNPYCDDFMGAIAQDFKLQPYIDRPLPRGAQLLLNSFRADVYVVNWLESICFLKHGTIQAICAILSVLIIRLRRKKLIWIYHNIQPHQGTTRLTKALQNTLFKYSSLIISHSQEAADYSTEQAKCPVEYRCHPVSGEPEAIEPITDYKYDILIWGSILPYKGILEFVRHPQLQNGNYRVLVCGQCSDANLAQSIQSSCSDNVAFENTRKPMEEIKHLCQYSRIVLFPYIGKSVSSSGALIDTIKLGGTPVGPNRGAFKDIADEGSCIVYNDIEEVFALLNSANSIPEILRSEFCKRNSWQEFGIWFKQKVSSL